MPIFLMYIYRGKNEQCNIISYSTNKMINESIIETISIIFFLKSFSYYDYIIIVFCK